MVLDAPLFSRDDEEASLGRNDDKICHFDQHKHELEGLDATHRDCPDLR